MAGVKISQLPAAAVVAGTDIYPTVQASTTKKATISQLATYLNSGSVLTGFVPIAGGTMTGPLILSGNPILPLGAATKDYVDTVASGFTVILAAQAATTGNLNAVQAGAGVGATLTNNGAMAAFQVDGYSANLNDRILVKNQTLTQHNGVYDVTTVGSGVANWVLTRSTDYDQAPGEIHPGTLVAVNNGTANANTSWLETATVAIVDTDPILFSQFTFGPSSFLLRANNLSDVNSVAASLVNLGLGVPTGTGNVVRQTSPTLITPTLGAATATTIAFNPTTGGIIGTNTNDSAGAGIVGQFLSSQVLFGAGVALASGTAKNVTSLSLSAGDWDVFGNVTINASGAVLQNVILWSSTSSATLPNFALTTLFTFSPGVAGNAGGSIPQMRYSVAGPTTVFLSCQATFGSGSVTACGAIYARRVR